MHTAAIVLAAGQGTRMKSALPKVMHPVCGLPMVHFAVAAALDAGCDDIVVVVGHGRELVEQYLSRAFPGARVRTTVQERQRGTGDAARVGLSAIAAGAGRALLMYGDLPLVAGADVHAVMAPLDGGQVGAGTAGAAALSLATCVVDDP